MQAGVMHDPADHRCLLFAGELTACFLPAQGMVCASLRHRGVEILRRIDGLADDAAAGHVAGIPLNHPWANRLSRWGYSAAGKIVMLDPGSPLLHADGNGTVIHGVPWSRLEWLPEQVSDHRIAAQLQWSSKDLLAVFPYRHTMRMQAVLDPQGLTITTTLIAAAEGPVPVSFGFHPYFGLANLPRAQWRLTLPAMQRLQLDARLIPTGVVLPFPAMDQPLGALSFDDGFALGTEQAVFSISGGGRRVSVEFLHGYDHAQIYAPADQDLIALEPMTAPTNALVTGNGLRIVPPGGRYDAAFRIAVAD